MLWVLHRSRRSRQQSKPSTRIGAGLNPNLVRVPHPLFWRGDIGEPRPGIDIGSDLSSPKRASWTTGLADRVGGEPAKNGGDMATSPPFVRKISRSSAPALSRSSEWGLACHRMCLNGSGPATCPTRRGFGQKTTGIDEPLISSHAAKAFCFIAK